MSRARYAHSSGFRRPRRDLAASLLVALALLGCKEDPIGPDLRTVEFVDWLDVDLATYSELPSGVFYKDLKMGEGQAAASNSRVDVTVEGWLPDGFPVQDLFNMTNVRVGAGMVIKGIDEALVGMRAGGERKIVVPPHLAHGRGQVMVFRLNMQAVR